MSKNGRFFCFLFLSCTFFIFPAWSYSLKPAQLKNSPLNAKAIKSDPIEQFEQWFNKAKQGKEANVFVLGTANASGIPSTRAMLLKKADKNGFVFYSSSQGFKAQEMKANPLVSMTFYWPSQQRQVNVKGKIELLSAEDSAAYFKTRSKESQLASLASTQGAELKSRTELHEKFNTLQKEHAKKEVKMPTHWQGYRVVPQLVEFWQAGPHTLHDRVLYTLENSVWSAKILSP